MPYEIHPALDPKNKCKRVWNLCMTLEDTAAFSDALRAAIPNLRFVSRRYWEQYIDWNRFKDALWAAKRQEAAGCSETISVFPYSMRDVTSEPLRSWDSLADRREYWFHAWVEPPGWKPVWGPPDWSGKRFILNIPKLEFGFERSLFLHGAPKYQTGFSDEIVPFSGRDKMLLRGSKFQVRWTRGDAEGEAFAKLVFKILGKLTTAHFIEVHPKSLRAWSGRPSHQPSWARAGHHADAWTLKRRHNYLEPHSSNLLKSAAYRFRPADIYTQAEVDRLHAENDAALEEAIRQEIEKAKAQSAAWREANPRKRKSPPAPEQAD